MAHDHAALSYMLAANSCLSALLNYDGWQMESCMLVDFSEEEEEVRIWSLSVETSRYIGLPFKRWGIRSNVCPWIMATTLKFVCQ
ncbi:hypothetical protein QQF64_032830 [Cirrhinus molitorella]|uniref:Uncharacterized protein n=1 Tax=Cirrhinus molitorella TaxID=172907 RepID=A0ABR3MS49_9TELE